jgi:hypothetical protein
VIAVARDETVAMLEVVRTATAQVSIGTVASAKVTRRLAPAEARGNELSLPLDGAPRQNPTGASAGTRCVCASARRKRAR